MEKKIICEINMVELANLVLDKYAFHFNNRELSVPKEQQYDFLETINTFIIDTLPDKYIFIKENIELLIEELELFIKQELTLKLISVNENIEKEDKEILSSDNRKYFIYHEDFI